MLPGGRFPDARAHRMPGWYRQLDVQDAAELHLALPDLPGGGAGGARRTKGKPGGRELRGGLG